MSNYSFLVSLDMITWLRGARTEIQRRARSWWWCALLSYPMVLSNTIFEESNCQFLQLIMLLFEILIIVQLVTHTVQSALIVVLSRIERGRR